ncbi:MAG: hypothetical protein ACTTJS_07410 [Wolinella sp.]
MNKEIYDKLIITLENRFGEAEAFVALDTPMLQRILLEMFGESGYGAYKEEVRRALTFFFTQRGLKSYIFFKNSHELALKTRIFDFESCIYTQLVLKQLGDISSYTTPVKNKHGVFILQEKVSNFIHQTLAFIDDEEDKKGLTRAIIKLSLALDKRDAIFLISNQIIIKKFQAQSTNKERRMFDGISDETLLAMEQRALDCGLKAKLIALAKQLSLGELSFSHYDNIYFAKNFIQIFQDKFLLLIPKESIPQDPLTQQAYANFLLRRHFDTLMLYLAQSLLELLVQKDRKAEMFVRFYNGDVTFSPEGKRFKKPDIIDADGNRWNSATIFHVVAQRRAGLEKIESNDTGIAKTKEALDNIQRGIDEQMLFIAQKQRETIEIEAELREIISISQQAKEQIFSLKRTQQGQKNPQELQEQINTLSIQIKRLDKEDERIGLEKKRLEGEAERAKIKIISYEKDRIAFEKKLERNLAQKDTLLEKQAPLDARYHVAALALAKAMSNFRGY